MWNKNNKKGALQVSFSWLFAIIVGAFILFLAIYFVLQTMQGGKIEQSAIVGKELSILLNPLETGFESGKTSSIIMSKETRLYNKCDNYGEFGTQYIEVSQKNFNDWSKTDLDIGSPNKYIFSKNFVEGKKFHIFSKPFEFPFKVADVMYLTSSLDTYCFVNAPENIVEEIESLNQENLLIGNCNENAIKICFGDEICDIKVYYNKEEKSGYVEKDGTNLYFKTDALMYAAIFSDSFVYNCHLKRLFQRVNNLALLYKDKEIFISTQSGCPINLGASLDSFSSVASSISDSTNLIQIINSAEEIDYLNKNADCKLW